MIKFPQRTQEQYQQIENEALNGKLLEKGRCQAEVIDITFGPNKNGIPMLTINYRAWDKNGKTGYIRDWIMYDENSLYAFYQEKKIREFCSAFNLDPSSGVINSNLGLEGCMCEFEIGIRKNSAREGVEDNFVHKYIKNSGEKMSKPEIDDDIPF